MTAPFSIIDLKIKDFMRIEAVEITPTGDPIILITGKNANGKSSIINAIWACFCWRAAAGSIKEPIRRGQEKAIVRIELGDLIVTRTWKGDKSSLTVTTRAGAKYSSPQSVLDQLVSEIGFDPLEFCRMQPKDQRTTLMNLLKIDFSELDQERAGLLQEKNAVDHQITGLNLQLQEIPSVPKETPDEEVSAGSVLKQIQEAQQIINEYNQRETQCKVLAAEVEITTEKITELENEITRLREHLSKKDAELQALQTLVLSFKSPDLETLNEQFSNIETINRQVRLKLQRSALVDRLQQVELKAKGIVEHIGDIDQDKKDALGSAKFPVSGLSFDETGILLNGVPFGQASTAEQIRVSLAMGIALNPDLRVLLIRDGNALDSDSMRIVEDMAREAGMQIFMERVDESGQVGIIIEDGMVKAPVEVQSKEPGQQTIMGVV